MRSPVDLGFCPQRLALLSERVLHDTDAGRIPGAAMLLARDGEIAFERAWGKQAPDSDAPMAIDSLFRIYSMTKPIVSVAVMMLAERGIWNLADPVSAYFPAFGGLQVGIEVPDASAASGRRLLLEPAQREMTLHDLLRHTAGLTYGSFESSLVKDAYLAAGIESRKQTNQQLLERLTKVPLAYQPGSVWEYSRATDVLGALLELVTGRTLSAFLQDEIFDPLGMVDTGFSVPDAQHHRIAEAFPIDPVTGETVRLPDPRTPPMFESGGGGLVSTLHDYLRFMEMLTRGGERDGIRLLSPRTVRWMCADHLGNIARGEHYLPGEGYGFGLGFAVRTANGEAAVNGSAGDYYWSGLGGTYVWCDPAERLIGLWMMQAPMQRHACWAMARNMTYAALVG